MNIKNILIVLLISNTLLVISQSRVYDNFTRYQPFTKSDLVSKFKKNNVLYDINLEYKYKGVKELIYYTCVDTLFCDCEFKYRKEFNKDGALIYDSLGGGGSYRTRTLLIQDSLLLVKYAYDKYAETKDSIILYPNKVDSFIVNKEGEPSVIMTEYKNSWIAYDKKNRVVVQKDSTYDGKIGIDSISYYTDSVIVNNTFISRRGKSRSIEKYFFNKKEQIIKHLSLYFDKKTRSVVPSDEIIYNYDKKGMLISVRNKEYYYTLEYCNRKLFCERLFEDDSLIDIKEYRYPQKDSMVVNHKHIFSPTSSCGDSSIYYNKKGKSFEFMYFHGSYVGYEYVDKNGIIIRRLSYTVDKNGNKNVGTSSKKILRK